MTGEKMINIISIEAIVSVTELAVHFDSALFFQNAVALVTANSLQSAQGPLPGATAPEGDRFRVEQPHGLLVEEAMEQGFTVQFQQLGGLDCAGQMVYPVPEVTVFLRCARQSLQQKSGGAVVIGKQDQAGGNLFRTIKVFLKAAAKGVPLARHYALIAIAAVGRNGNGHPALPQQIMEAVFADCMFIEAGQTTDVTVVAALGHECAQWTLPLGLDRQRALKLQGAAHQNAGHQGLAQQLPDSVRIGSLTTDFPIALSQLHPGSPHLAVFEDKALELVAGCHVVSPEYWMPVFVR